MKRISNFTIIFITLCMLIGIVATTTTLRINKNHEEKLIYSMESKIAYYAKRCYLEEKCKDTITLQTLYDNEYIENIYHPVTKELLNSSITIEYDGKNVKINW